MSSPITPTGAGPAILARLREVITRYVILPSPDATVAVALWIAATHAQPAWAHAPRLVIRAPEKRCGKSRLLDIVEGTCHAPLITVNASPAAVYRAIASDHPPTLLVDEADTIFSGKNAENNDDLRGLLNAGHQRNRPAIRWDSGARRLETMPTFAMAALAGIGAMPDTIEDRAVVIRMRRRAPGERVAPFRHRRDRPALTTITEALAGWLGPRIAELEKAEPAMPLEDRAADTWEPLIAIADLAGADWPQLGREAALALTADHDQAAAVSDRVRLLADCRTAFGNADALPTSVLIARLREDPEAPWSDHGPDGISARRLGVMLADYDIRSANIRFGEPIGQVKGYYRTDFADAWTRYCPGHSASPSPASQTSQPSSPPLSAGRRDGTTRPKDHRQDDHWDGTTRPKRPAKTALTCDGTAGTAGTDTPRLTVITGDGGAA